MNFLQKLTVRDRCVLICFFLALGVWLSFGQAIRYDFVNYDDDVFVYQNPFVLNGLSASSVHDVLTRIDRIFYYPLTTLSLMLDAAVYGLNPFGFHLTNVLLHMINAILLFLVLQKMTDEVWRSALVAFFWAIHPLRVESVVWITERKDVLSGFFFMLTLLAYTRYVRFPFSLWRYLAVFLLYLAGLMSKPMLVTLPCVLLLLDWWPLNRLVCSFHRVFWEKIPLFVLTAAFCVITWNSDRSGNVSAEGNFSFLWRIGNALISYVVYVRQLIVPTGLAVPYPVAESSFAEAAAAFLFLAFFSVAVILLHRKKPYLLTGWFWYIGILVPVLGVFRILGPARADRFTYLPQIGLCFLLVWAVADRCTSIRRCVWVSAVSIVILAGLVTASRLQSTHWRDSETLWTHTLACTEKNVVAHSNIGAALFIQGRTTESIPYFEKAIRLGANHAEVFNNMGTALADTGDYAGAVRQYFKALSIQPERAEILKNLADTLAILGDTEKALRLYELAIDKAPDYADALQRLAWILAVSPDASFRNEGRAVAVAERAAALCAGRDVSVLYTLAAAYAESGQFPLAIDVAHRALAVAIERKDQKTADRIRQQLDFYEQKKPYRESAGTL